MRLQFVPLALLLWATLLACSPQQQPQPGPTPVAAATVTPAIIPTSTAGIATPRPASTPIPTPTPVSTPEPAGITRVVIGSHTFHVEVADISEERARGLMGRESLPANGGMLFVFDHPQVLTFWMKNTLIPLDILFIDADGVIVDVQTMEPEPGVADSALRRYTASGPALYALEVNAGTVEKLDIEAGMTARFE